MTLTDHPVVQVKAIYKPATSECSMDFQAV